MASGCCVQVPKGLCVPCFHAQPSEVLYVGAKREFIVLNAEDRAFGEVILSLREGQARIWSAWGLLSCVHNSGSLLRCW